jgi:hypothetical protein
VTATPTTTPATTPSSPSPLRPPDCRRVS